MIDDNASLLATKSDKQGRMVFVYLLPVKNNNYDLELYYFKDTVPALNSYSKFYQDTHRMHIIDIIAREEDGGLGNIAIESMLDIAKELNVESVTGRISPFDMHNVDKLTHFYEASGFEVDLSEEYRGKILWKNPDYKLIKEDGIEQI